MRPEPAKQAPHHSDPEYVVLEAGSARQLTRLVNAALRDGWKPQGGVSGFYNLSGYFYIQAMVRGLD